MLISVRIYIVEGNLDEKEKIKNKRSVYFSFYSYYILVFIVRVYEMFFLRYILELHMVKSREKYVQKMDMFGTKCYNITCSKRKICII